MSLALAVKLLGTRAHSIFADGVHLDQGVFEDLANTGRGGRGNIHRNLTRKMAKKRKHTWSPVYMAKVRVWNPRAQEVQYCALPMLLPHEIVYSLLQHNEKELLTATDNLASSTAAHLQKCKDSLGDQETIALGLWGDGVPCNWNREESLEVLTLNLPGLSGEAAKMRLPLLGGWVCAFAHTKLCSYPGCPSWESPRGSCPLQRPGRLV